MNASKLKSLYLSRCTMFEVLEDRRYIIDNDARMSFDEFKEWAGNDIEETIKKAMTLIVEKMIGNNRVEATYVFWPIEDKLGDNIQGMLEKMGMNESWKCDVKKDDRVVKAIVISDIGITPSAQNQIKMLHKRGIRIDSFTLQESMINVTKHVYQPTFEVVGAKELKKILSQYGCKKGDLPSYKLTNPVVRHFGVDKGTLFKVKRESITQPGEYCYSYALVG